MFNASRKQDFIAWYPSITSPYYIQNLFNKTKLYEECFNKDVSDFLLEQIIELMRSLAAPSINSLRIAVCFLRTYADWCISRDMSIDGQNHYKEITTDILMKCTNKILIQKKVITTEQLSKYADELINVCDKFILYGVYEGLKGENYCELTKLSINDIDPVNRQFKLCTGRILKVSDTLLNYAIESSNQYQYFSTREDGFFASELKSNLVFKPRNNVVNESDVGAYHRLLKRIFKVKGMLDASEITLPRLYNSGIINEIINGAQKLNIPQIDFLNHPEFEKVREQYNIDKPIFQLKSMYKEHLT